jgi:ubiquinone/menaquinone biosynthesis C-methylase UbiE
MTASEPREYVLGTGADELERLALQNRLWSDASHALWKRAQIRIGHHVLDVGCGPGYASFELAQIVGHTGRVVGVDESPGFIEHLNRQAQVRGLPHLTGVRGDVQDLPGALATPGSFDLAYARWVLCFVADPEAVVRGVSRLLKPGGRFCVQDYFNYASMTTAPRLASHDKAVAATVESWKARGGDPDVVGRLPRLMEKHGLRIDHIGVNQRLARGGDTMFHWPDVWWRTFTPKLVQMGLLTQADQDELFADLERLAGSATDFILVPPVFDLVGTKL